MKKIIFYVLISVCGFTAIAQQSALIKLSQPGSGSVSYIFATSHHKNIIQYDIENALEKIIQNVNAITFDWLQDDIQRQKMFEIMQFKGDDNVKKIYKREDNIRYELMVMDKLKSDVENYAHTQPLYTTQLFRNLDHAGGIDFQNNIIFQLALNESKPVLSILSVRQMEEIIYLMDFETQAAVLSNYVNNAEKFTGTDDENLKHYLNGNLDAIAQNIIAVQYAAYLNITENKKSEIVLNKIMTTATQQSILFVIDAGLLGGNNGILKKLSDAGFIYEPLNIKMLKNGMTENENAEVPEVSADNFPVLQITEPAIQNATVIIRTDTMKAF
ncbi:MAG: TraB/GumN family protein, partial [Fimbriimonadaceae bacterium]|nr:TraB/GumN family protein [Chitinophagales bacterium]